MQPTAHAIAGNNLERGVFAAHLAAETEAAEHRIIRNNRGSSPQRAAIAEVRLRRVVPGPAMVRLSKPRHAVRRRLETSTCSTIVFLTRKPVAETALPRACIHQGPRAEDGCEAKANRGVGLAAIAQSVIEHTPATHRRHVGQRESVASARAIVAAVVVVRLLHDTAAEKISANLSLGELSCVCRRRARRLRMIQRIPRDGLRRFKASGVERVFRAIQVWIAAYEERDLLLPVRAQL